MTNKEIDMILEKTMNGFNVLEANEIYVHIQAYRRALTNEFKSKVTFAEALNHYIEDIFLPVSNNMRNDKTLKKIIKKYGFAYSYLIVTECLISSKKLTPFEMIQRVSFRTEDLKKRIAA